MKKAMILFVGLMTLMAVFSTTVLAKDDITDTPFEEEMRILIDKNIMEGYTDGTYRPQNSVTRAEFTTFLVRALDVELKEDEYPDKDFNDVTPNHWHHKYVMSAYNQGIVDGYPGGDFRPNNVISRQDMAMMMMNAAESEGLVSERLPIDQFKDSEQISPYAVEAVERLTYLEIINGKKHKDNTLSFAPKDETSRGETAAVITRLLDQLNPPENLDYSVVSLDPDGDHVRKGEYETFDQAVNRAVGSEVVLEGNNVVWIKDGMVSSNKFTILYNNKNLSSDITYVTSGVEMELIEVSEDWVKVKVADTTGYVDPSVVNLTPTHMIENRSYYTEENGALVHYLYNSINDTTSKYTYGAAPGFMETGKDYYSWNGNTFYKTNGDKAGEAYQYFNRMPLYTETKYTAEQLDDFVKSEKPNSPLVGTGESFKKAEKEYGTNALYLLAHAIHESNWGQSEIAAGKNNLFGIGAVDSNPYENAKEYTDFESGILEAASDFIVPGYFNDEDYRFNGAQLGNKSTGMNVKYASDAYWGQKIAGHMYRADQYLSNKSGSSPENGQNDLAQTVTTNINVRSEASTDGAPLYQLPKANETVEIIEEVDARGTWYEITPKNILENDYEKAFVYSDGYSSYGTSLEKLPIAE
ncbi:S-layer homology domain-containing protein [Halobacillus campisalis]|uniref:S-layer homology domain-containing protein n=1 Tax=Halobacillus campisalis TaxID=435909 RepID=A0ABW2K6B8_9BACI|nr:S-layer homology domain-containing protein [Halobacillus campisalis]